MTPADQWLAREERRRIVAKLQAKGLSQQSMAEELGVSRGTIRNDFRHLPGARRPKKPSVRFVRSEWVKAGRDLAAAHRLAKWRLGDWVLSAIEAGIPSGVVHDDAARITKIQRATVANYASLARRIPPRIRRKDLDFSVHEPVANLPAPAQKEWLAKAADKGWTREELRRAVKGGRQEPPLTDVARRVCREARPAKGGGYVVPDRCLEALAKRVRVPLEMKVEKLRIQRARTRRAA